MLRSPVLHKIALFRSPFLCKFTPALKATVKLPTRICIPFRAKSMSGKTVADVVMGAARAASEKKAGRPPLKHQAKGKEKGKEEENEKDKEGGIKNSGGVDEKISLLSKKAAEFDPRAAAFWKEGEHVPFLFLARALDLISNEFGRIAITEILCNVFRTVIATTPGDLLAVVYLSANKVAPSHEGVELGIGDASIIKALSEAFGRKEEHVKSQMKVLGDLGLVAKASRSTQRLTIKPTPLTCIKVLESFRFIAKESGKESQDKKRARMKTLLVAATDCEPQYLVRLLQSKMRIGLAEQTVLVALGHAAVYSEQSPVSQLRLEECT